MDDDLQPVRFPAVAWRDTDLAASLDAVYHWVEGEVVRAATWYLQEKRSKAHWSRALRAFAVVAATAGATLPFVAVNTGRIGVEWGYVFLTLAAGAVALDRFFGFSSAWMRYMATEVRIQQSLIQLQFEWATILAERGERMVTSEEATDLLKRLAAAADAVADQVLRETMAWADEFRSNIGELRALASQAHS